MGAHEPSIGKSDDWYTPRWIFDALGLTFDLDPCSPGAEHWVPARRVYTIYNDGLAQPWSGLVFMNPPLGGRNGQVPWLKKFFEHGNGIAVVRAYTSAGWFHEWAPRAETWLFPNGKTRFIRADGTVGEQPGSGSIFFGMGAVANAALERSGLGIFIDLRSACPNELKVEPAAPGIPETLTTGRAVMNRHDFLTQAAFSEDRRLLPHQIEQAIFAVERERSINASETGTGKFLVALGARRLIEHEAGAIVRVVYTCPKSALGQFEKEFADHGYQTFVLRHGSDAIPANADTVLAANSTMVVTHCDQLRDWHPTLVVLDEAVAFKNAEAARTKAIYGGSLDGSGGIIDGVRFVLAMSGTLAPGHNGELFPHLRAIAPESLRDERGRIMRRHTFETTFCVFDARRVAGGREVPVIVGSRNSALLRKRIDPYVARITLREIAPTLPPERHEVVPIAREDVKLEELAAIADIEDPEVRAAVETLAAAIRDGFVPASDIDREMRRMMEMIGGGEALAHLRRAYGLAKLPYAEDVVMSRRNAKGGQAPALIFNTYRMTGDRLEALLAEQDVTVGRIHGGTSAVERHAVISGIQDGSIEAAILQVDAAGSALNLQAANRIVMLEPSWTPGANHQAVARAVRIGQQNPVLISWPVVRCSIDEAVMRTLRRKQDGLAELWAAE
jgi:hypothetical protein